MIAIIDYEIGNLRSVEKAFEHLGIDAVLTRDKGKIDSASRVLLPGVGAFGDCMAHLKKFDLLDTVKGAAASGRPFLGICVGMQMLFDESEEFGRQEGLGLIPGRVSRFPEGMHDKGMESVTEGGGAIDLKVPQMGWNSVEFQRESPLTTGIESGEFFYFVHSYYCTPDNTEDNKGVTLGKTIYGDIGFTSMVNKGNVYGLQFHPEKSQRAGLKLLENFAKL